MTFPKPNEIPNAIQNKTLVIIWFTLRQLLYSRLNIGVIILVLIPVIAAGSWATDAFDEQREELIYSESLIYDPQDNVLYFDEDRHTADVNVYDGRLDFDYNNNNFKIALMGTSSSEIEHMEVRIAYYYNEEDLEEITNSYSEIIDSILNSKPGSAPGGDVEEKLYVPWDYNEEDDANWTNCTHQFNQGSNPFVGYTFKIKVGEVNALPFEVPEGDLIFKFGKIEFDALKIGDEWDWSRWSLNLEFGKLGYVAAENSSTAFIEDLSPTLLRNIEATRLYWPNGVTVFIDAFTNSSDNKTRIGQEIYTVPIDKLVVVGSRAFKDDEPEGHIIFITHIRLLYFAFINPIIILLFLSMAVSEDRENRTITYLISRPVSRYNVLTSKFLAANLGAIIMVIPSITLTYFLMSGYKSGIDNSFDNIEILFVISGVSILGMLTYSAIYMLYSTILKFPLVFGLIYIFLSELIITNLPFTINRGSVAFHLTTIAYHSLRDYNAIDIFRPAGAWTSGITLVIIIITMWAFANLFYTERDIH